MCTCYSIRVASAQQHMLCANVSLLTRSRRPDAACATSERDTKRARRADADYSTSERDAKRARRADANQKNGPAQSGLLRPPKSMRRERGEPTRTMRPPNAMRRERGAPTRTTKNLQPSSSSGWFFIWYSPLRSKALPKSLRAHGTGRRVEKN